MRHQVHTWETSIELDRMADQEKFLGRRNDLSSKLGYIVGFGMVEMAISTNWKPTIYRNLIVSEYW